MRTSPACGEVQIPSVFYMDLRKEGGKAFVESSDLDLGEFAYISGGTTPFNTFCCYMLCICNFFFFFLDRVNHARPRVVFILLSCESGFHSIKTNFVLLLLSI